MTTEDGGSLSWLESPQPYTVTPTPDGITIECPEHDFDIVITEPPPVCDLRIVVHHRLTLRAAPSIDTMNSCPLHLIADNANPTKSDIEPHFPVFTCSTRPSTPTSHRHELTVTRGAWITIIDGDWHLDAYPEPLIQHAELSCSVHNEETSLRISSGAYVDNLECRGDHMFDLLDTPLSVRKIYVQAGTATLLRQLNGVQVEGRGTLRTLSRVSHCNITMDGNLDASGIVENSNVVLGGDVKAAEHIRFGNHELKCRNATLENDLSSDGVVSCEKLEVKGHINSTGTIMARELNCTGTLKAAHLAIIGSIEVPGS